MGGVECCSVFCGIGVDNDYVVNGVVCVVMDRWGGYVSFLSVRVDFEIMNVSVGIVVFVGE